MQTKKLSFREILSLSVLVHVPIADRNTDIQKEMKNESNNSRVRKLRWQQRPSGRCLRILRRYGRRVVFLGHDKYRRSAKRNGLKCDNSDRSFERCFEPRILRIQCKRHSVEHSRLTLLLKPLSRNQHCATGVDDARRVRLSIRGHNCFAFPHNRAEGNSYAPICGRLGIHDERENGTTHDQREYRHARNRFGARPNGYSDRFGYRSSGKVLSFAHDEQHGYADVRHACDSRGSSVTSV